MISLAARGTSLTASRWPIGGREKEADEVPNGHGSGFWAGLPGLRT